MTGVELFTLGSMAFTAADAVMAVSAITGALGAFSSAQGEANMHSYNAAVAQNNAIIAEQQAKAVRDAAAVQEQQSRREARLREGKALAGAGDLTGSFLDVFQDDAAQSELDALTLRYNGVQEANVYLNEASRNRAQAGLDNYAGSNAKRAGYFDAAGSLLTLGSVGTTKKKVTTAGPPPRITGTGQGTSLLGRPQY